MSPTLRKTLDIIAKGPHSAPALTLYALICTLEIENAGCMFKLNKLRDLNEEERKLAYELMEIMVAGDTNNEEWKNAKQQMDELVRAG